MKRPRLRMRRARTGMSLIELTLAMTASSIIFLAIMNILSANHVQWNETYTRVAGDVVNDAYMARRLFDRIVRKASASYIEPSLSEYTDTSTYVEVHFYSTSGLAAPDKFARFEYDEEAKTLLLAQGDIGDSVAGTIIAQNVTSCTFSRTGRCIHMALVIDDGKTGQTVAVSAVRHNAG